MCHRSSQGYMVQPSFGGFCQVPDSCNIVSWEMAFSFGKVPSWPFMVFRVMVSSSLKVLDVVGVI